MLEFFAGALLLTMAVGGLWAVFSCFLRRIGADAGPKARSTAWD